MSKHPCAACNRDSEDFFHENPDGLGDYWFCKECMDVMETPKSDAFFQLLKTNLIEAALRMRHEDNEQIKPSSSDC